MRSQRWLAVLLAAAWSARAEAQLFCPDSETNLRIMTWNVQCTNSKVVPIPVGAITVWTDGEDKYDLSPAVRASRIASIVRHHDPDVVVLQEVFNDECRDEFEKLLSATYPFIVRELGEGPGAVTAEDSGLMLFSKHQFEGFANPDKYGQSVEVDVRANNDEFDEDNNFVAYHYFDSCFGHDCMAAKMAAMVRIRPAAPGSCAVNVAFAHLQADAGDGCDLFEKQLARFAQMQNIHFMIDWTLTDDQIRNEPIFIVGDLNIDGNLNDRREDLDDDGSLDDAIELDPNHDASTDGSPEAELDSWPLCLPLGTSEWASRFDPGSPGLFACGLAGFLPGTSCQYSGGSSPAFVDAWAFEHPKGDLGQTHGLVGKTHRTLPFDEEHGSRLDYILHNQPRFREHEFLCAQHVRRHFWLDGNDVDDDAPIFSPGTIPDSHAVSDHFALIGDFYFSRKSSCNPVRHSSDYAEGPSFGAQATVLPALSSTAQDFDASHSIGSRRNFVWRYLNWSDPLVRTISVGTSQPNTLQIDVYHWSDLSEPTASYHGLNNSWGDGRFSGPTFHLQDPPYYIRISVRDGASPTFPFNFNSSVHQHRCTNAENDLCTLVANEDFEVSWPSSSDVIVYEDGVGGPFYDDTMYFAFAGDKKALGGNDFLPDLTLSFEVEPETDQDKFDLLHSNFPGEGAQVFAFCPYVQEDEDCGLVPCNSSLSNTCGTWSDLASPWSEDQDGDAVRDRTMDLNNNDGSCAGIFSPADEGRPRMSLLRVKRSDKSTSPLLRITYRSTLKKYQANRLQVFEENDFNDLDEIWLRLAEGPIPGSCEPIPSGSEYVGEFDLDGDDGMPWTGFDGQGWTSFYHATEVGALLCEDDTGGNPTENDMLGSFFSQPLPPNDPQESFTHDFTNDGHYHYRYVLSSEDLAAAFEECGP